MTDITNTTEGKTSVMNEDCTPMSHYHARDAYNDFILRLEALKNSHPSWSEPRNQQRPFKPKFLAFIRNLIYRMPVAPEVTPLVDGTVRFFYKKTKAPRDKWQTMEIIIYPRRHFKMTAKTRIMRDTPFVRTNTARPDYLSDMVRSFFELDCVNTKDHPIRFRTGTIMDYPYLSAMCQTTMGPFAKYSPQNIQSLAPYTAVAYDPQYGIVSCAGIGPSKEDAYQYEVQFLITLQNYRGLGLARQCLHKALTALLKDHPDATVIAKSILPAGAVQDVCKSPLRKVGFKKIKIVKGEKKYSCFECDRCNADLHYCEYYSDESVCSTVYYELQDRSGKV